MLDQDQSGSTLTMFLQRFYGQLLQIQVSIWNLPKVIIKDMGYKVEKISSARPGSLAGSSHR